MQWIYFWMFIAGFITDFLWAWYILFVGKGKLLIGAFLSVGIGICSIIFVEGVVQDFWSSVAWLVGLFVGTYYSTRIARLVRSIF